MDSAYQFAVDEGGGSTPSKERHYTPKEIAELWQVDESTVRKRFIDEPGVLKLSRSISRRHKRSYVTLRIPASVLARYHREHTR